MFTRLAILCCHLVCGCEETKSPCKSYEDKEFWKRKILGHRIMHGKAIWKSAIGEIAKASRGNITRGGGGIYSTPYETPAARGQYADTHWVMAYFHKTQSFMKNGVKQKCLYKAMDMYFKLERVYSRDVWGLCWLLQFLILLL